jgi:hypothetical protein
MTGIINPEYQNLESDFQRLDHETKKKKIISILEYIKDDFAFAWGMLDFIMQSKDVSDGFLCNTYELIMWEAVDAAQEASDQQSADKLANIQKIANNHQQIDETEHQTADKLINQI